MGSAVTTSNHAAGSPYPDEAPVSQALFDRAKGIVPGGVNSPVRAFKSVGGCGADEPCQQAGFHRSR